MSINPYSVEWLAVKAHVEKQRELHLKTLASFNTDERRTNYLRGQLQALAEIESLAKPAAVPWKPISTE